MPFDPLFCKPLQPFAFELIILVCTVASRTLLKLLGGNDSVHTIFGGGVCGSPACLILRALIAFCLCFIPVTIPVAMHRPIWRPRPELNWDTRFRKPLLYPFELRGHNWLRVAGTMRRFIKRVYHTIAGHRQARLRGGERESLLGGMMTSRREAGPRLVIV